MTHSQDLACIILAAGKSSRMQYPKALLPWNKTTTFIEKIVNEYQNFGCQEIVLVVNPTLVEHIPDMKKITTIVNKQLQWERFYSLKLATKKLYTSYCFVHNIDNPFIDSEILEKLTQKKTAQGYTVPVHEGKGGHPILLSRKIIEYIRNFADNDANLRTLLSNFQRQDVVANELVRRNINTPQEYYFYFGHSVNNFRA